jgi:hypothetical protein
MSKEGKKSKAGFFSFQHRHQEAGIAAIEWSRDDYYQYAIGVASNTYSRVVDGGEYPDEFGIFTRLPGNVRRPSHSVASSIASTLKDQFKGEIVDRRDNRWYFSFTVERRGDDLGKDRGEIKLNYSSPDVKHKRQSFSPDD